MGETYHKIKIGGRPKTVTGKELDTLLANDPQGLISIEGEGADSFFVNSDGDVGRGKLSAEALRNRKNLGEENVHFGTGDPKEGVWRKDYQRRTEQAMAEKYQALVAIRNFVPGIQAMENAAVGVEDATHARQNLIAGNPLTHIGSTIGSFFAFGGAAKMLARGTKLSGLIGAHRSSILGKTTQLATEDALLETHIYTQHIWNNNQEFIVEDWAEQVAEGLLFVSPLIGSYAARALVGKGLQLGIEQAAKRGPVAGRSVADIVSRAADIGVIKGLMTKPGLQQAATMRRSAGARVLSRLMRGRRTSKRVTMLDELDGAARVNADEFAEINRYTPEWFQGRRSAERLKAVQRLREVGAEDFAKLNDVKFANVVTRSRKMQGAVARVPDHVQWLNKQIKLPKNLDDLASVDEALYDLRVVEAYDRIHNAGYGDIANHLENTFHLDKTDVSFGRWAQARMDARVNKGPGWTVMDAEARRFLEDAEVWGTNTAGRGQKVNKAIDRITSAGDEAAGIIDNFPKKFDEITTADVDAMTMVDEHLGAIEEGYRILQEQGLLTTDQLRGFKNKIGTVRKKLDSGKQGYFDAAEINKARKAALEMNKKAAKELEATKASKSPEELAAVKAESAVEGAATMVALRELIHGRLNNLRSTMGTRNATFGVLALKEAITIEERDALYAEVSDSLRAMVGNPVAMQESLRDIVGNIQGSDPVMAMGVGQKAVGTMYYLASQLPKAELSHYGKDVPVAPAIKNNFLDKLVAAVEPVSVGVAAVTGRVTPGMVEAVRITNPSIYAEMMTVLSEEITKLTPEQRRKAPRVTLMGVEAFLGGMNPTHVGISLMQLQSTYAQTAGQQQAIQGTGNTMKNPGPQASGSDYTTAQRVTGF